MITYSKRALVFVFILLTLGQTASAQSSETTSWLLQSFKDSSLGVKASIIAGSAALLGYSAYKIKKTNFEQKHPILKKSTKIVASSALLASMAWFVSRLLSPILHPECSPKESAAFSAKLFSQAFYYSLPTMITTGGLGVTVTYVPATTEQPKQTLKDFVGDIPPEAQNIVRYIKDKKFQTHCDTRGRTSYQYILLTGDPGNGKTQLMRSIAGETNVPLVIATGADLLSPYNGKGAINIKELFDKARKAAADSPTKKCLLCIDECDAVMRQRDSSPYNQQQDAMTNQFLAEMDGVSNSSDNSIILIGTTNRPGAIDRALIRSGRFKTITIPAPSMQTRVKILMHYLQKETGDSMQWTTEDSTRIAAMTCDELDVTISASTLKEWCTSIFDELHEPALTKEQIFKKLGQKIQVHIAAAEAKAARLNPCSLDGHNL